MEKLDRRVVRTRQMLRRALLELVQEKGYDAITVQDITDKADLRRATFYLHYTDKDKLLLDALEATFDALAKDMEATRADDVIAGKTQPEAFRAVFEHVAVNAALYRDLLTGQGAAAVSRRIRTYLADLLLGSLRRADESASPVPFEVLAHFMAGAEVNLIVWWLENGMPYTAAEMARMTHRLTLGGVKSALGSQIDVTFEK